VSNAKDDPYLASSTDHRRDKPSKDMLSDLKSVGDSEEELTEEEQMRMIED
jgi:hypothetical protein